MIDDDGFLTTPFVLSVPWLIVAVFVWFWSRRRVDRALLTAFGGLLLADGRISRCGRAGGV